MSIVGPFLLHPAQTESSILEMERKVDELFHRHRETHTYKIEKPKVRKKEESTKNYLHSVLKNRRIANQEYMTSWRNSREIVHVIYTRFMQHQPNLVELGKARLELFKTFCLTTIAEQTNQQFFESVWRGNSGF